MKIFYIFEFGWIQAFEFHGVQVVHRGRTLDKHHVGHVLLIAEQLEGLGCAVHNAHLARLYDLSNCVQLGAVQIAVVFAPLQVFTFFDVDLHSLTRLEVVAAAVLFVFADCS